MFRSQLRIVANDDTLLETTTKLFGWRKLEPESNEFVLRKLSFLRTFLEACNSEKLHLLELILFCAEGNNIPEALQMADAVSTFMGWNTGFTFIIQLILLR
jgi:hypothetical protein